MQCVCFSLPLISSAALCIFYRYIWYAFHNQITTTSKMAINTIESVWKQKKHTANSLEKNGHLNLWNKKRSRSISVLLFIHRSPTKNDGISYDMAAATNNKQGIMLFYCFSSFALCSQHHTRTHTHTNKYELLYYIFTTSYKFKIRI